MANKFKISCALILLCLGTNYFYAQTIYQTVRGSILDKISQSPIPGAVVMVVNSNPTIAATSDENGNFSLANVPIGKQSLSVSFLGYAWQH